VSLIATISEIISIAVTWGHESESSLIESKPDYTINDPQELIGLTSQEKF
jgi:phosphoglycolate phosphatase-like HAD superfamily hydrolase